jgi:hypothetical protein
MADLARSYLHTMTEQVVRDRSGKELGKIRQLLSGKFAAYDRHERELGTYDPRTDKTYDRLGVDIGRGNQLHWLLTQAWQE